MDLTKGNQRQTGPVNMFELIVFEQVFTLKEIKMLEVLGPN